MQSILTRFSDKSERHTETYKKITDEVMQAGFSRTKKQVTDKIKNLRQFYKDIKDGHERMGYDRDTWPYFELIDVGLRDRPFTRPQHVIDTTEPPPEEEIGANDGEDGDEEGGDEQDSRTLCQVPLLQQHGYRRTG